MTALFAKLRPALFLLLLVAASWGLRAPFLQRAQWNLDEGVTFTMAQQIREGAVLYRDAADHRSPLVPYLKAAVFAVAGDWNVHAVHLLIALALGVVAFLLWDLCRRFGDGAAGAWTAGAFTLLSLLLPGTYDSFAAHTEWFVVIFSALGFWFFARAADSGGFLAGLPAGLAFGASALCKQPGLLDFGVIWVLLAFAAFATPASRSRLLRLWLGAALGVAAWFAVAFAYFAAHGALRDFLYYGWTYNTTIYLPEIPPLRRLVAARVPLLLAWQYFPPAAVLAVLSALALLRRVVVGPFNLLPWLILGWSASGLVSCVLSGREFDHYSIQALPGISLACGWLLARFAATLRRPAAAPWRRTVAVLVFSIVAGWTVFAVSYFRQRVDPRDDASHARVAALIQRYAAPRDLLLQWGYFPEAHLIAHRLPATRFVYSNFLTGLIPWTNLATERDTRYAIVPGAWDAFWRDYRAHPPAVIVEAVMRGYLKYPLLGRAGLRDEIVDSFAEMEHPAAELLSLNLYRRLAPLPATFPALPSTPDPDLKLHPARVPGSPDLAFVRVAGAGNGGTLTLRLGGRPYRCVQLPADAPVDAAFYVRLTDLAAPGAALIDAVLVRDSEAAVSAPLDVVRRLNLEVYSAEPVPVLDYSTARLSSATSHDPALWHPEPRGESLGWRTSAAFALAFERPPTLEIFEFEWQPPAGTAAAPTVLFAPATGPAVPLALATAPTADPARHFVVELPAHTPGKILLQWQPAAPGVGSAPSAAPSASAAAEVWLGALLGHARGPGLSFRDRSIPPAVAVRDDGRPLTALSDGSWDAGAPSRLLYPRLPRMNALVVDYGFADRAYTDPAARPGEIGFEVNFVHEDGRRENLHSDLMRPRLDPSSRGRHSHRVGLPPNSPGEIELKFGVVPGTESPDNQAYLFPPRVQGPGPDLTISPDRILTPVESETLGGEPISICVDGRWIASAPGHIVYNCPPDLRAVNFGFGIDERAYWGDKGEMRTNGIDVSVEFRDEHEKSIELYRRRIDPRFVVPDRGVQHGRIELPGRPGRLVFHFSPGPDNDASYDWSYWTDFTGEVTPPAARP